MAQTKAVTRALHSFCRQYHQYALAGGTGRRRLYIYEPGDPVSAAWVQLTLDGGSKFSCVNDARMAVANAAESAS